jgi:hypothetical protein
MGTIAAEIKTILIPACDQHEGIHQTHIRVRWTCPVCGGPRGEINTVRSYDGSRILYVDGWNNPCGHVDKYVNVREEAWRNGLNHQTAGTD